MGMAGNIKEELLELLYPRRCPVCDRPVAWKKGLICPVCREQLVFLREPLCRKCGKPLEHAEAEYCYDCRHKIHRYDAGAALFEYPFIKDSIYRFKYRNRQEYAAFYAQETAARLGGLMREWQAQALVPVPIHPKKQKQRGYNQAQLYAQELSGLMSIPVAQNLVLRCKNTVPQKLLDDEARQNNLKRAFKIARNDVKLDTIIIIDDIYTTGSTIDAVADTCKAAGISKAYFIALAIGEGL